MPVKPPSPGIAVGSGAGGAVAFARGSFSIARLRSSIVWRNWRSGLPSAGAPAASLRSSNISWRPSTERARADLAGLAQRTHGRPARLGERPHAREERVEVGGGALEVREQRCLLVGQLAEARHRGTELVEELGEALEVRAQLVATRGRDLGGVARLAHPAHHVALVLLELVDDGVRVSDEVLDDLVLVTEDAQHLRGLAQARMRSLQHLLEVVRAPREAGAELGHDQAEALAVRAAHDVVDDVRGDRRGGLLHRHDAACRGAARSTCRAGSPRSTRRSATAAGPRSSRPCGSRRSRASRSRPSRSPWATRPASSRPRSPSSGRRSRLPLGSRRP